MNQKPSEAQIGLIFQWFRWEMPSAIASNAVNWLEANATKVDCINEIKRLKELKKACKLNRRACFDSDIWAGYPAKGLAEDGGRND